jgi:hypothetical protein
MRTLLLISLWMGLTPIMFAQPNGGFENWITEFTYESPEDWQTMNILSLTNPPNPLSAFKAIGIDRHSGNYALKIKSVYVNNNPANGMVDDTMGMVFKGKIILSPISYRQGFPYTERPEKLQFYSKYNPVGNDTASAAVVLKRWNGTTIDTVGAAKINIPSTPQYTLFEINIDYRTGDLPDSALIVFFSSRDSLTARVGSTLFVDDVAFTTNVGINNPAPVSFLSRTFPNPAREEITIQTQLQEAFKVYITDVSGKTIGNYYIEKPDTKINTRMFSEGTYFYEIRTIRSKTIDIGKFSVIK